MEPAGAQSEKRRFVVLRHEGSAKYKPGLHWDLMFESGESLRSWALTELPVAGREIEAERLPDHRLAYLDYEGPISGDRGSVGRWDSGDFELISESPEEWVLAIAGRRLSGRLIFHRETAGTAWQCRFEPAE